MYIMQQGLASSLHNSSIFTNIAFATLTSYLDTQPFLHLTVHDFLWGFDDPLVQLASKLFPKWIHFPRLGIMDRVSASPWFSVFARRTVRPWRRGVARIGGPRGLVRREGPRRGRRLGCTATLDSAPMTARCGCRCSTTARTSSR